MTLHAEHRRKDRHNMHNDDDLLTTSKAARRLRMPEGTLRYFRHVGIGPRSARLGRRVVYRRGDLEAWIAASFEQTARGGVAS